ncbi:hypothetical protein ACFQL7_27995 [Halocatena marina]|uniref:CopG family transcriptional regulator n=1 Tax=Halocatena marina TaxID=2934937 RepID=A0ABD5YYT2_9EURY
MSDEDDPFADLSQTLDDEPATEDESDSSQEGKTTSSDTSQAIESVDSDTADEQRDDADEESSEERDPLTEPAFPYEAANQRPFYARDETIGEFDAWLNYELERDLSTRGFQSIEVREMTDALLRTVVEEDLIDDIAERFEQAREKPISQ